MKNTGVSGHFLLQGSSRPMDQTRVYCTAAGFLTVWAIRDRYNILLAWCLSSCFVKPKEWSIGCSSLDIVRSVSSGTGDFQIPLKHCFSNLAAHWDHLGSSKNTAAWEAPADIFINWSGVQPRQQDSDVQAGESHCPAVRHLRLLHTPLGLRACPSSHFPLLAGS